ncbi:MAG: NnrS family protein, partial [Alphaproteobacteria bacterium]|nr:NnrS family protein [Alphaproteobacteria bacterium]
MTKFFSYGFRPFFLFAGIYAVAGMAAWLAWIGVLGEVATIPPVATDFPPFLWHAHEMLFGYTAAALAGFLLTASPSWSGKPPVAGAALAFLAGVWVLGRVAIWFSAVLPAPWVAAADLAFLPVLWVFLWRTLAGGSPRHFVFLGVLAVLFAANVLVHLERLEWFEDTARTGHLLALDVYVLLITVIGGRVVPAFTRGAIQKANPGVESDPLTGWAWLDQLSIASVLAVLVAGLVDLS